MYCCCSTIVNTCIFSRLLMILSVKNNFDTLFDSVRFVVSSCPENASFLSINRDRISSVSIFLPCNVASGRSFYSAGKIRSGAVYSFAPATICVYRVIESIANSFSAVVKGLVCRPVKAVFSRFAAWKSHLSKKSLFSRQAVLACSGGLRL